MPPMTPTKKAPRRASRVEDNIREQKPRARRRQSTEAIEGFEQEISATETREVGMSEAQSPRNDQDSSRDQATVDNAFRERKRRRRDSKSQPQQPLPDSQGIAQKYGEWKDDLEFIATRGTYWGTVAPRLPDYVSKFSLSKGNEDEQKREGTSCTPCILQGLDCSGDKPICAQCKPQDGVASSTSKHLAMCSYPINRAFIPKSKHVTRRKMKEVLESNLAAAVEYLDGRSDSDEEGGEEGGEEGVKGAISSSEGSQKTGTQSEADSVVLVPERTVWLAKALLAEGRENRASYATQTETRSKVAEEAQDKSDKPVQLRKRGRPRGSRTTTTRDSRGRVISRLLRCDAKPRKSRKGELLARDPSKLRNILKSTSRMLKAAGTWIEAPTTPPPGQELESVGAVSSTDESDENGKNDIDDNLDTETTTAPIPKYKKQIANTFRPWVAQRDDKVIPSACDLPETTFLQAIHYYASYYYTHISPSPDMFEAMDLTSHIALGMIIQEIISDFAFKLGKESQLEDIQVKVDKLTAAQHRNKWDTNFVEYLKGLTAGGSLPPQQRSSKRRQSRSGEETSKSMGHASTDTDEDNDNDDIGHGFRLWDELEGLRRTTTSLGVSTMKELVNRTSFNLDEDADWGIEESGYRDKDETHSGGQQQLDRHLSAFTLDMDIDVSSSDSSDVDKTISGSSNRWTRRRSNSSEATALRQSAFHTDGDAEDDVNLESDENDTTAVNLISREEDDDLDQSNQDENYMPEIDFSQSIFSQLSNKRFGSQFKFRLEDSTDEDEDEDEGEAGGVDRLRSRTPIPSPIVQDKGDTSSETESDSSKSGPEKVETEEEKESDVDETMDAETDVGLQDEEDFSPSVLTQVNETRLGSAFTARDNDSSSEDDFGFNLIGGRFLAQSQVVQDDSDDSSDAQEDSSESESEQEEGNEGDDSVPELHKEEEKMSEEEKKGEKEKDIKEEDGGDSNKESRIDEWNGEEKESDAEEATDVEMGYNIQDEEKFSSSVLTQVSETRFGSAFTSRDDDSSSEDDFGFNLVGGRFLAQSQVVQDDSDDSSEAQEDSSASESEQEREDDGEDGLVMATDKDAENRKQDSKDEVMQEIKEEKVKEEKIKEKEVKEEEEVKEEKVKEVRTKDDEGDSEEEGGAEEESDMEETMHIENDGGIQIEEEVSPSVLTKVGESRFASALTSQDQSSRDKDLDFNIAGGRLLAQSQVVQDFGSGSSKAQEDDEEEDSVAAAMNEEETVDIENSREDDSGEESDAKGNVDADLNGGLQEIEDDFPASIFTQLSQSGFSSSFTSQDDGSSDEDFSFNIDGGRSMAQSQVVHNPAKETLSREGSIELGEQVSSQQLFTTLNATRFGSQFSNSYDASDDDDESEDGGAGNATQSQVVLDDSTTDEEDIRVDSDSSDSD
ncbi:hypothetical protein EC991_004966 [Linnemannia zychae]|nr:hypothetical protein EC991_004966 [Linnemannia zychae]